MVRMKLPWYERKPELLDEVRTTIAADQPDLRLVIENGKVVLRGSFALRDDEGTLDRYQVEIIFPEIYPDDLPVLKEIGGRIPRILDRHMVHEDGSACLLVPEEWFVICKDRSFRAFMEGAVKNFFLGQMLVEDGKPWPFGERSHGRDGIFEAYLELLGIDDRSMVLPYLDCLRRERIKGHWDCPCGSKTRIRNCHREQLMALAERIPPSVAQKAYMRLSSAQGASRTP